MFYRLSKSLSKKIVNRVVISLAILFILSTFLKPLATEILSGVLELLFQELINKVTSFT